MVSTHLIIIGLTIYLTQKPQISVDSRVYDCTKSTNFTCNLEITGKYKKPKDSFLSVELYRQASDNFSIEENLLSASLMQDLEIKNGKDGNIWYLYNSDINSLQYVITDTKTKYEVEDLGDNKFKIIITDLNPLLMSKNDWLPAKNQNEEKYLLKLSLRSLTKIDRENMSEKLASSSNYLDIKFNQSAIKTFLQNQEISTQINLA